MNTISLKYRNKQHISRLLEHKLKLPQDLHQLAHAVYDFNGAALQNLPDLLQSAELEPEPYEDSERRRLRENAKAQFLAMLQECRSHLEGEAYIPGEIRTALCILLSCYYYNHHLCDDDVIHDLLEYIGDYRISLR